MEREKVSIVVSSPPAFTLSLENSLQNHNPQQTHKCLDVQRRVKVASELDAPRDDAGVIDCDVIGLQPALRHLVGVADDEGGQPERIAALGLVCGRALADAEPW